jgi:hypothetical protein
VDATEHYDKKQQHDLCYECHTINTTTDASVTQSFVHFKFIRKIHKIGNLELAVKRRTEANEINGSEKIDLSKYNKSGKKTDHCTQIQPIQAICAPEKATVLNVSRDGSNKLALFFSIRAQNRFIITNP